MAITGPLLRPSSEPVSPGVPRRQPLRMPFRRLPRHLNGRTPEVHHADSRPDVTAYRYPGDDRPSVTAGHGGALVPYVTQYACGGQRGPKGLAGR